MRRLLIVVCAVLFVGCKSKIQPTAFAREFAGDAGLKNLLADVSYSLSSRGTFDRSNSLYVQRRVRLSDGPTEKSLELLNLLYERAKTAIAASGGVSLGVGYGGDPREYAMYRYRTSHVYGIFMIHAVYRDDNALSEIIFVLVESNL